MKQRPEWDEYFFEFAKVAAIRSNCIRANVGAVIVDEDRRILSTGYNGTPSGVKSCLEYKKCYRIENNIPSGTMYETCRSIHAEQNAIIQIGRKSCKDAYLYVYGHNQVCILCKRFIINAGIKKVYLKPDENSEIIVHDVQDYLRTL
ncbi:MAG: dCMP deaminase family protein [bacterium]